MPSPNAAAVSTLAHDRPRAAQSAATKPAQRLGNLPTRIRVLRRTPRTHVDIPVAIVRPSGHIAARIVDISTTGVGLAGVSSGATGDRVRLLLPGGRLLDGEIRWHTGDRCGISLDAALAKDDPLLARTGSATSSNCALASIPTAPLRTAALERAIRKQGSAWLTDEAFAPVTAGMEDGGRSGPPTAQELGSHLSALSALTAEIGETADDAQAEAVRQRVRQQAQHLIDLLDRR